jgi:hypothetical protein
VDGEREVFELRAMHMRARPSPKRGAGGSARSRGGGEGLRYDRIDLAL